MKITEIRTYVLKVPLKDKAFLSSQCPFPERNSLLVKITTDSGVEGWGEGGQYGPPEPVRACIDHVLSPRLIGKDPLSSVVLTENLYATTRDFGQRGTYVEAISAIDVALWDLRGKVQGLPVSSLLGGAYRDRVQAYATGAYYPYNDFQNDVLDLDALAEEAKGYLEKGFTTVKIKIGLLSLEEDFLRVETIKKVVGDDVRILIDCNHAYNSTTAEIMAGMLEKFNIGFLEEPVPPEDLDGYARLRGRTTVPIAGGECFFTAYDYREVLSRGCVDILQPDICVTGGFTEFIKIRALAMVYNTMLIPHVWGSGVAFAAALQAISTIPMIPYSANPIPLQNIPMVEYDQSPNPLRDELLVDNFRLEEGSVVIPDKPGLGIEINPEILAKYSIAD